MKTSNGIIALLVLSSFAAAQTDVRPASLALRGDPAQDLDLGATRIVPMPMRSAENGPIDSASYYCMRAIEAGDQVVPKNGPKQPRRMIGEEAAKVMPWLTRVDPKIRPSIIWTRHWTIVGFLKDAQVDDLTPEEAIRLRAFFPKVTPRSTRLTGHQRTHLWAIRTVQIQRAIEDLLDLDENGGLKPSTYNSGYRPLAHKGCELFLFSNQSPHDAFRRHLFQPQTRGLGGEILGSGPVTAITVDDAPSAAIRRRVLHASSLQLLRIHRRLEGGIPAWIRVGLAHYFEWRQTKSARTRTDEAGTLPAGTDVPRDWNQAVRNLVASGKAGELGALSVTPERGLTLASRLQAWSLVKYLLGIDPKRFGQLCAALLHTRPDVMPQEGLRNALKATYGHYPEDVATAWKTWVLKGSKKK
ncbi:MAG: hypothetical protein HRU14_11495 [Planctomycetes bacterium]|nr:hypothetical protein [Planctomycetota bacterium]